MTVAALVSVIQLAVVGSWGRSVRLITLVQAVSIGFMVCGPVTILLEWLVTRAVAALGPWEMSVVVSTAAWTYNPFIEEIVKIVPLVVLALWASRSYRQLGWTDHLLVGGGLGVGFTLCEAALRYAKLGSGLLGSVSSVGEGYSVVSSLFGSVVVPSVTTSLTTWLPDPVRITSILSSYQNGSGIGTGNGHLLWTALAAIGVAWMFRRQDRKRWLGLLPLVMVSLDHAIHNAGVSSQAAAKGVAESFLGVTLDVTFGILSGLFVIILLALVAADRVGLAKARSQYPGLLLPGEPQNGLNPAPMLKAGMIAPPWSVLSAWGCVLERRAALNALGRGAPPEYGDASAESIGKLMQANNRGRWQEAVRVLLKCINLRALRSWKTAVWVLAMAPAFMYLVVGAFPATQKLQRAMEGSVGTALILIGAIAGGVLIAAQIPGLIRGLRGLCEPILHENRIRPSGQLLITVSSLTVSAGLLIGLMRAGDATQGVIKNSHILEALTSAEFLSLLALTALMVLPLFFPMGGTFLMALSGRGLLELAAEAVVGRAVTSMAGRAAARVASRGLGQAVRSRLAMRRAHPDQVSTVKKVKDPKDLVIEEHPHDYRRRGNYGEMKTDIDLESTGKYRRVSTDRITDIDAPTKHGIDGVYHNPNPQAKSPEWVIADSKYMGGDVAKDISTVPNLGNTNSGRQLSDSWIEKHITDAVDDDTARAIRRSLKAGDGSAIRVASKVDDTGAVTYYRVDAEGRIMRGDDNNPITWIP